MAKRSEQSKSALPAAEPQPSFVTPTFGSAAVGKLMELDIDLIRDSPGTCDRLKRRDDQETIAALAASIRDIGQLQPIMVEVVGSAYVRVFGSRRIAAAKLNNATTINAIVVAKLDERTRRTIVAVENIQRQDLSPAEEHVAVADLLEMQAMKAALHLAKDLGPDCGVWAGRVMTEAAAGDFAGRVKSVEQAVLRDARVKALAVTMVAAMLAKSENWVKDRMYISRLGEFGRSLVLEGRLPLTHAREIVKVADPDEREDLASEFAAGQWEADNEEEPGSLESLRQIVSNKVFSLTQVPWRLDVTFNDLDLPACIGCRDNSDTAPGLFRDGEYSTRITADGRGRDSRLIVSDKAMPAICSNHSCYSAKTRLCLKWTNVAAKAIMASKEVPPHIREVVLPEVIQEGVAQRKQLLKDQKKQPGKLGKPISTEDVNQQQAKTAWRKAMQERAKLYQTTVAKAMALKPGCWLLHQMLQRSKIALSVRGVQTDAKKVIKSPEMVKLLALAATPSLAAMLEIEKACGVKYGIFDCWYDGPSGYFDAVAESLDCILPPPPTVDMYLPKPTPPSPSSPKQPAQTPKAFSKQPQSKATGVSRTSKK